jgi:phage-related protein
MEILMQATNETAEAFDTLNGALEDISGLVDSLNGAFDSLETTIDSSMGGADEAIIGLQTPIDDINGSILELQTPIENIGTSFDALNAPIDSVSTSIDAISGDAATAAAAIDSIGTAGAEAGATTVAGMDEAAVSARGAGVAAGEAAEGFDLSLDSIVETLAPMAAMFGMYESGKEVIEAGIEDNNQYNAAVAQVANQLKTNGDAIGMNIGQLEALAEATGANNDISKAANMTAISTLLNYNQIGKDALPTATQAVDDLATKMAMAKGQAVPSLQQISQAAKMVGKAMEDPATGTTAFTRAMVTFSPAQDAAIKAMQKAGDTAGAQKLLMEDLAAATSGAASSAAETFQGKIGALKKQMDDFSGSIMNGVETALSGLGQGFVNVASFLNKYQMLMPIIVGLSAALAGVLITALAPAIGTVAIAIGGAIAAAAPFILIAAGVAVAAYLIISNWKPISAFFVGLWNDIVNATKPVWQAIQQAVMGAWNVIAPTIISGIQTVQKWWDSVWPEIQEIFTVVWDILKPVISVVFTYWQGIFQTIGSVLLVVFETGWNLIKDSLKTIWDVISGVVKTAWDLISGIIKLALDTITGVFKIFQDLFSGNWSKAWTDTKALFSTIWDDISGIFVKVVGDIGTTFENLASDALQWGGDLINGFIKGIESAVGGLVNTVKNVASTIASYLHFSVPDIGPLADADTYGPDMINLISNGILSGIPNITSAAKQAAAAVSAAMQPSNVIPITAAYTQQMTGTYGASAVLGSYGSAVTAGGGNSAPVYNITVSASNNVTQSNQQLATMVSQAIVQQTNLMGKH